MITWTDATLDVLALYSFDQAAAKDALGLKWVKENGKWRQELILVKSQDMTCLNLFLSLFRIGCLAHTSLSLKNICIYLNKHDCEVLRQSSESKSYLVFKTVCQLANRHLMSNQQSELFKKVSEPVEGPFNYYWNPAMEGRFLLALQQYYLPQAKKLQLRFKESQKEIEPHRALNKQDLPNIEVGYAYEMRGRSDDYYYYYPKEPYYQTSTADLEYAPRRRVL